LISSEELLRLVYRFMGEQLPTMDVSQSEEE